MSGRPASRRPPRRPLLLLMLGLLVGACGGTSPAAPAPAVAPAPAAVEAAPDPSALAGDVRLQVTGFHLFRVAADDAAAAAADLGVPAAQVGQVHLLLRLRNDGTTPRSLAGDRLRLEVGERAVEPSTADAFPPADLAPGAQVDSAVGFHVALRAGSSLRLLWSHGGSETALPIGSARRAP